jgi:hypothetical protein
MKPGDLVRIRRPEYFEEYWEQVGVIVEVEYSIHPLRIMTSVGIGWFSQNEVDLVNDGDPSYDIDKEPE